MLHQMARIVGRKPEVALVARGLLVGQFGQLRAHALDELIGQVVGCQIRLGEQAVVVGGFLDAHHDGALGRRIPMTRLLVDDAALLEHLGLAADLVGQAVVEVLEAVHVLELGLGAELGRATAAQAHVAIAAQAALLHRAIGDPDGQVDLAQLLHEQARLLGRAQIRLGHQLDKRRAGAVVVDEAVRGAGDAALAAADVHHLAGVLLHVDARDAHVCHVAVLGARDVGRGGAGRARLAGLEIAQVDALLGARAVDLQIQMAAHAKRDGALGGLEVLGHVGVHVVLAVEHRMLLDVAVGGQAREHDRLDGGLVGHRQRAGQPQAHRAGVGVGSCAELQLAAAEHLGLERGQLGVDLQADDRLPILQDLFELLHGYSPAFPPA